MVHGRQYLLSSPLQLIPSLAEANNLLQVLENRHLSMNHRKLHPHLKCLELPNHHRRKPGLVFIVKSVANPGQKENILI